MTIVRLLAKKHISRQLFKICRMHGFETRSQVEDYFWTHGSFKELKWCSAEDIEELESLIDADLIRIGRQWKIPNNLLKSRSLVKIADFLLETDLLPRKQMQLLKESAKLYQGAQPRTVFELAPEMAMSETAVRGLRTCAIHKLSKNLRSLQVLRENLLQNYQLELSSDLVIIDEPLAAQINERAKTHFSSEFLGWLFGIYLEEEFTLLGRPTEVLAGNILGNRHYWSGFYLLRKDLAAALDFNAFLSEIYRLRNNGSRGSRSLNFKTFVSHFLKSDNEGNLDALLPVIAEILSRELGLRVKEDGNLVLSEQKDLHLRRYCLKALEAIGEPATRGRIRRKISEQHPEVFVDLAGFASVMLAQHGFTSYKNLYGLRIWFSEGKGSLKFQDRQLLREIQKKSPIRSAAFWKSYWDKNWEALMDFANTHSRLPKNGATGVEASLRKFWNMQVARCGRGKLAPEYQALLNELRRRFPHNKRKHWKVDWDERFAKIKAFADLHGVPPHWERTAEEKTMNGWLQAQRSRRGKGHLDRRQEALLNHFDELYHLKSKQHFQRHWEKRYKELEDFGRTHSRLPREIIKEEKSLNRWFAAQRLRMSKGTLSRRQYFLIKNIIDLYPLMGLEYLKGRWHEKCGELERFAEAHSRLPKSIIKEEKPLYKWFQQQQLNGSRGRLDEQQLARLQQLAENFRVPGHFEKNFDKRLKELKKFVAAHSRLPKKAVSEELSLYKWYTVQLRRGAAGNLNPRQQKSLKELCEPLLTVKPDWKERFRQVKTFAETHSRLPKRTALTEEEKVLNRWFMVQKDRMKKGRLVRRERKLIQFLINRYATGKAKTTKVLLGD